MGRVKGVIETYEQGAAGSPNLLLSQVNYLVS